MMLHVLSCPITRLTVQVKDELHILKFCHIMLQPEIDISGLQNEVVIHGNVDEKTEWQANAAKIRSELPTQQVMRRTH